MQEPLNSSVLIAVAVVKHDVMNMLSPVEFRAATRNEKKLVKIHKYLQAQPFLIRCTTEL